MGQPPAARTGDVCNWWNRRLTVHRFSLGSTSSADDLELNFLRCQFSEMKQLYYIIYIGVPCLQSWRVCSTLIEQRLNREKHEFISASTEDSTESAWGSKKFRQLEQSCRGSIGSSGSTMLGAGFQMAAATVNPCQSTFVVPLPHASNLLI